MSSHLRPEFMEEPHKITERIFVNGNTALIIPARKCPCPECQHARFSRGVAFARQRIYETGGIPEPIKFSEPV